MDTGQIFDWSQLSVVLLPVNENDTGFIMAGSSENPAMSGVNKDGGFELKNVTGGSYTLLVGAKSNNLRDYITNLCTKMAETWPIPDSSLLRKHLWTS